MNITILLIISVILPITIATISVLARKYYERKNTNNFFYAGGNLSSGWGTELFISTSLALGNAILYFTYLGYTAGASGVWLQIAWCLSFFLMAIFAHKVAILVRNRTIHGVLGESFGMKAAKVAAIMTVIGFTLNLGWELVAGFSIFSILNLPVWASIVFLLTLALGAAFYTAYGGMKGNLVPNRVFNIMSYVALVILTIFLVLNPATSITKPSLFFDFSFNTLFLAVGVGGVLSTIFLSLFWQFVDMSAWQNLASTKIEGRSPAKSLRRSSVALLAFGTLAIFIGMLLKGDPGITADNLLPSVVNLLSHNHFLFVVVISGLVAAMLSTIDGFLLASSNTVVKDIYKIPDEYGERGLKIARISIVLLAILGTLTVFFLNQYAHINLFNLIYVTYSAQLALFPAVLVILLNKKISTRIGSLSLIFGIIGGLGMALFAVIMSFDNLLTWAPLIGLGLAAIIILFGFLNEYFSHAPRQNQY